MWRPWKLVAEEKRWRGSLEMRYTRVCEVRECGDDLMSTRPMSVNVQTLKLPKLLE